MSILQDWQRRRRPKYTVTNLTPARQDVGLFRGRAAWMDAGSSWGLPDQTRARLTPTRPDAFPTRRRHKSPPVLPDDWSDDTPAEAYTSQSSGQPN